MFLERRSWVVPTKGIIACMESYRSAEKWEQPNNNLEEGRGDWVYEKIEGQWRQVLSPEPGLFDSAERERRSRNTLAMLQETAERWKLEDKTINHNEGFLRDHPRYHELFEKWAIRYLRMRGQGKDKFSGKVEEGEGRLYGPDGKLTNKWLVNEVANGREWIDENIMLELRISEGFVDITHDNEKRVQLSIEPEDAGWWTRDEI